ncbi:hypothetical protein [Labedaea rhizosphaerae]|uniref:Secreted protein n=1 Tax=Labedaea rhizosphaerae TaxID=598644 RepID=A0A4R6SQD0_LABRH|nr:hypothetical protein [Labedaea rhizosphaerae]TDQ05483.1 hypothetical protein EV186_1011454 [Labedaea rhizosphaerae]
MVTTAAPETGGRRVRSIPATMVRNLTESAATSPGRLTLIMVGLFLLTVVTSVVGVTTVLSRQNTIDDLINHQEPLSAASQQIYRSLSDADATASSAFLAGGVEPADLRSRYEADIAQAGAALAKAAGDVGGVEGAAQQVNQLSQALPVYTGLVETARANNRQGFPTGGAYLREASTLMRSELLPAAQELFRIDIERLNEGEDDATAIPWFLTGFTALLLAALIASQIYLTKRTNRLLNVGLLVATIAVGVGVIWGALAMVVGSAHISSANRDGSQQVDVLVQARIVALQCRANETLTLVARGDGPQYETDYQKLIPGLVAKDGGPGTLLAKAKDLAADNAQTSSSVNAAIDSASKWHNAHLEIRKTDDEGDYQAAVKAATGTEPTSAAQLFAKLDSSLDDAIMSGRKAFVERADEAGKTLTGLGPGLAVLGLVALAGVTMGIRRRLQEYR